MPIDADDIDISVENNASNELSIYARRSHNSKAIIYITVDGNYKDIEDHRDWIQGIIDSDDTKTVCDICGQHEKCQRVSWATDHVACVDCCLTALDKMEEYLDENVDEVLGDAL